MGRSVRALNTQLSRSTSALPITPFLLSLRG